MITFRGVGIYHGSKFALEGISETLGKEVKEFGILVLEARDLNDAIQLISQNPGVKLKCGLIEIRPAADLNEMMRESERRRRKDTSR